MKIRHIIAIIVTVMVANATFGAINNALKRSDYHHCKVTTNHSAQECKTLTEYEGE